MTNRNSSINQRIKAEFVKREVFANVNTLVEYVLQKSYEDNNAPFSMDDLTNYYVDNSGKIKELQEKIEELQEEIANLENGEILLVNSTLMEEIKKLEKEIVSLESDIEDLEQEQEQPQEVYEWWIVSGWLCEKLKEKGKVVLEDENIWGRTTTGQAILLDGVISEICEEMEILEGQKYEWKI